MKSLKNVAGFGRRTLRSSLALLSVPLGEQASGRRWDCSDLSHVARRCFGTKWCGDVPGVRSTRDGDTGNEDNSSFARFFKLDKYVMFSFAMTTGLASDSDKFKGRSTRDGDTGNEDNSSFARFFKLDKYVMFGFAMTSGLGSDSDKFKIIITQRRARKFGDTRPYKNFIFLKEEGGIAQAWATWLEGASAPNGTVKCRGHGVPEMVTPAMRTT